MKKAALLFGRQSRVNFGFISGIFVAGCSVSPPDFSLPDSLELGSPRGNRIVRTLTHLHSPYSYDACDSSGISNGKINSSCAQDFRKALCTNRVDFAFLTDHPAHMTDYPMSDLLLSNGLSEKDQLVLKDGLPYANRLGDCVNSFTPTLLVGFESTEMALGMSKHLEESPSGRLDWYNRDTLELRNRLNTEADAVVVIPHTESKTLEWIRSLSPDAVEIYNFHGNLDPKIRKQYLGLPPFSIIPSLISYLIDPYRQLIPDFSFLSFLEIAPIYFSQWNSLISEGRKITGLGGTDSHQNVLPQLASDGERLDSHRRMLRMMSNHLLISGTGSTDGNLADVKTAIKQGRSWVVFEGLGSPVGMDFFAVSGGVTTGVGETGTLQDGSAKLTVQLPSLHSRSPRGSGDSENPVIRILLKHLSLGTSSSQAQTVASTENSTLEYTASSTGAYRAEIYIVPKHLKKFLGDFESLANKEFPWVITNHLYLN